MATSVMGTTLFGSWRPRRTSTPLPELGGSGVGTTVTPPATVGVGTPGVRTPAVSSTIVGVGVADGCGVGGTDVLVGVGGSGVDVAGEVGVGVEPPSTVPVGTGLGVVWSSVSSVAVGPGVISNEYSQFSQAGWSTTTKSGQTNV